MKRILFVDDEPAVLDGLRARLRCLRSSWEMVFVESGARAIAEIEQRSVDVIVSDMRMPVMDGAQLLASVAERWPETVRIVLSGYSEEEKTARLLSVAHQHLSKPCDVLQLENAINRCFQLHELLREQRLRAIVGRIRQIPAMPRVYSKLRAAMGRDDVSVQEIAQIVCEDPAIAAKVLQVVNSSFFRIARRIARVDQAISYLGFAAIRNIVMSVEVFSQWQGKAPAPELDPEHLQARAQKLAATARALAEGTSFVDDAMLAGLLHNIGYWVLLQECPLELERALLMARARSIPLHVAEREVIGASHAEIGAYLLGLWGLPHAVVEAVAFHHEPDRVAHTHFDVLAAIVIARHVTAEESLAGVAPRADAAANDKYLQALHVPYDWHEAQQRASKACGDADL
jgi:HD-like signal output (HDOD) protein